MKPLGFREFAAIHREVTEEVWARWTPAMQQRMARHCRGWSPGRFDFRVYLDASVRRNHIAYLTFAEERIGTICDVGGFWGVFPATLARLGYAVTLTESLRYYGDSFSALFEHLESCGVRVIDYDPFGEAPPPVSADLVTVMAVLEHYPHSLRRMMGNVTALMAPGGLLYLEAPNIAYWPKRVGLLHGHTPLPSIEEVYESEEPYLGHHHEFTRLELRRLAELADLEVRCERAFTYSVSGSFVRRALQRPLETFVTAAFPATREVIAALCARRPGGGRVG